METDLYLGIDDTDGPDGMCTTYLMTRIIEGRERLFSGYPRLVRLNPNIPYRTRGNGALSVRIGTGNRKKTVGYIDGNPVCTSVYEKDQNVAESEVSEMWNLVKELSAKGNDTNPGMVLSDSDANGEFYSSAVGKELDFEASISYIDTESEAVRKAGTGRGVIGSFASISWPARRKTFEVMAYSFPNAPKLSKQTMLESATYADSFDFTFNSMDYENNHASIFPNPRTPVIFGIRGTDPDRLLKLAGEIIERFNIGAERYFVFETNQGTDDHLLEYSGELAELSSYKLKGRISLTPHAISGGHYFSELMKNGRRIKIAAFEPTKEFRRIFSKLVPGDEVELYGSYMDSTINVEKLRIISLASLYTRFPPDCPTCGKGMKTEGKFSYICTNCGENSDTPKYVRMNRDLAPGFYEVPVCARRHLSAPIELLQEGSYQ